MKRHTQMASDQRAFLTIHKRSISSQVTVNLQTHALGPLVVIHQFCEQVMSQSFIRSPLKHLLHRVAFAHRCLKLLQQVVLEGFTVLSSGLPLATTSACGGTEMQ